MDGEPEPTCEEIYADLDRYKAATLSFANEIRRERGAAAISALPTGFRDDGELCPLACALGDCGKEIEVTATDVSIDGVLHELPDDVSFFVESFDGGCYSDLEVKL